jgi:hypothetical protein
MNIQRTDLISMFDLQLHKNAKAQEVVDQLKKLHRSLPMASLLTESAEWLFDPNPDLVRVVLEVKFDAPHAQGATILFDPHHRLGVLSVWHTFGRNADPLKLKREFWGNTDDLLREFGDLGFDLKQTERLYPFLSIRLDDSDISSATRDNAVTIGRLFTGDFESEEERYLKTYVDTNFSHRSFERLLVRWTDAFAMYGADGNEREHMVLPMLRAAQIYELCILLERTLRKIGATTNSAYRGLSPFRPWTLLDVGRIQKELSQVEERYFLAPNTVSVEAKRLLYASFEAFGVLDLLSTAKQRDQLLDARFQWTRTQLLVVVGVLTWCVDTVFKLIRS